MINVYVYEGTSWKENHGIQQIGIEDCTGDIIVDKKQVLNIWDNRIM
jgi:hypothetical protein